MSYLHGYSADLCVVCADFMLQGGETLIDIIPSHASKIPDHMRLLHAYQII